MFLKVPYKLCRCNKILKPKNPIFNLSRVEYPLKTTRLDERTSLFGTSTRDDKEIL